MSKSMTLVGTLAPNGGTYFHGDLNDCREFLRQNGLECLPPPTGWAGNGRHGIIDYSNGSFYAGYFPDEVPRSSVTNRATVKLEQLIASYQDAISAETFDPEEIERCGEAVEKEASRIGYNDHMRLIRLHTAAENRCFREEEKSAV